jgi:hypothetical protein
MSARRRVGAESGFIGDTKGRGRSGSDDYDQVNAGGDNNASGFAGGQNSNFNNKNTGFEGLASNQRDNNQRDGASNRNNGPREATFNDRFDQLDNQNKRDPRSYKPVEKPLTHVDKETVGKVVDLKDKYQK